MEQLERREMLAGDVAAYVARDSLILLGDSADNDFEVSTSPAGEVQVVGRSGTTVNGSSTPYVPWAETGQIPQDLRIYSLAGGNNRIRVLGINAGDDMVIYGGRGTDDIAVLDSAAADKLNVLANGGRDKIRIGGTLDQSVASSKSTYVNLGWGGADVGIANMRVDRDLNIVSLLGGSHVALSNTRVGDDLSITATAGDDVVAITGSEIVDRTSIKPGAGNNTVVVDDSEHRGDVSIRTSWGRDFIAATDSNIGGMIIVQASYGVDQVGVAGTSFGGYTYVSGGSKFDTFELGEGNSFAMTPRVRKFESQGIPGFRDRVDQVFAELGEKGMIDPGFATIGEIATTNPNFQTLRTALELTGLIDVVNTTGPFTVFAPTDTAFAKLPAGTLETLIANPTTLADILLYHVAAGNLLAADVVSTTSIPTVLGPGIDVTVNGGVTLNGTINVLATDVLAANGVVHIIDGVLLPPATV